jgi:predicted helicase
MMDKDKDRLKHIKTLPQLAAYLRDELEWPIESDDIEDLTFEYDAASELGLSSDHAVRIKEIKQIRPLVGDQPWGIFWINFEKKRLPVVILRRILRALVIKKRETANKAERQAWQPNDLLFISAYGEEEERAITFAHFVEDEEEGLAELRVLGWDDDDTPLKYDYVAKTLNEKLGWRSEYEADHEAWRQNWRDAFLLRHREVIDTAKELAAALADLAKKIRGRARSILRYEDGFGEVRKLQRAFQQALIHDLSDDDFADMYAQTVTYGLFSAAVSRPAGIHADNLVDMVPVTNPFLREMLATFLNLNGRKGKINFDELGIQDVVKLLNDDRTHLDAVLRDFGRRTRQEDPVIHFYEAFLSAYDKKRKVQRGVFYTPQPVVSYIVRSVNELLQTEFGLEDGLASTVTWGEMLKRQPEMKLPPMTDEPGEKRTIDPDEFFVQILDPATGTATFPVEVIDVIYNHLKKKHAEQGPKSLPRLPGQKSTIINQRFDDYWNAYVPAALLPRLYAYELMMAPYAIAHMKIGLKLHETGYKFASDERARIYLTNALEPKMKQLPTIGFDALAHEAAAVNEVKWYKRFTVVIGNPPYSYDSANQGDWVQSLLDEYRTIDGQHLRERNSRGLNDDYVKFIRFGQHLLCSSRNGILGFITNHGYISNTTFRGMRQSLTKNFSSIYVLDLHGNSNRNEICSDGSPDQNIFDILQGVGVLLATMNDAESVRKSVHAELFGRRADKYAFFCASDLHRTPWESTAPITPFYLLAPHGLDVTEEYNCGFSLAEMFGKYSVGISTSRDTLCINESADDLYKQINKFATLSVEDAREQYSLGNDVSEWSIARAQADLRRDGLRMDAIAPVLYRPFDIRFTYYTGTSRGFLSRPRPEVMKHMLGGDNVAICSNRQVNGEFRHACASRWICDGNAVSLASRERTYLFPLWFKHSLEDGSSQLSFGGGTLPNFTPAVLAQISRIIQVDSTHLDSEHFECAFHYSYAILHSPKYRVRYEHLLKNDFPRIPFSVSRDMFMAVAELGRNLIGCHLLECLRSGVSVSRYVGDKDQVIKKAIWSDGVVWLDEEHTHGFQGVSKEVWSFYLGGYQPCQKWLKDRKGRTLSDDDITHYHKIVVALSETIRLMAEIDQIIEQHGGWPGAFQGKGVE